MSATALSIIIMAIIAGAGLVAAIIADTAPAATGSEFGQIGRFSSQAGGRIVRCSPKIVAKCPKGHSRTCIAYEGGCCVRFSCQKMQR